MTELNPRPSKSEANHTTGLKLKWWKCMAFKSNASFLSLDLLVVQNDNFSSSQAISHAYTYASVVTTLTQLKPNNSQHNGHLRWRNARSHFRHHNLSYRSWITLTTWARNIEDTSEEQNLQTWRNHKGPRIWNSAVEQRKHTCNRVVNDLQTQRRHFAQMLSEHACEPRRNETKKCNSQLHNIMATLMKHMLQLNQDKIPTSTTWQSSNTKRSKHVIDKKEYELNNIQNCWQDKRPDSRHTPYKQFNFHFHTDHRAYYVDFDTSQEIICWLRHPTVANMLNQNTSFENKHNTMFTNCNAFLFSKQLALPGNC